MLVPVLREQLAGAVADRYSLERDLGRGGMASVYLARDRQSGEMVALKAMHQNVGSAIGLERFRREMGIAASLDHPYIVPLTDSGSAGDLLYYVMPYVQGESLSQRLDREQRLPVAEAIRITQDVAQALGYAHHHGILHRDVKPENVLLADGHALIADFGLARAIGAADRRKLTSTGVVVGTVHYMSPEQLLERSDLDQRSDVYSLGCILYEMLTGSPPYTSRSITNLVTLILRAALPSVRTINPMVPEALDQVIARALAKNPEDRFGSMEEFSTALGPFSPAG
ncbi:MAG TPA: serine/threonine-protein kinase [Gemmatimonadales bacterium]|jgi:serine/threonine-protein kinase|nr:serine/threonine-protein kinase [Gemmatimonadales bacterium]